MWIVFLTCFINKFSVFLRYFKLWLDVWHLASPYFSGFLDFYCSKSDY